jgi:hypothetical protein
MRDDPLSRIMQWVLASYSQYHNRKYKKIGHLFQGRYKSILCQSDRYLGELVRYIHLNPVRARLARRAEKYEYSGHRAYVGLDTTGLVDTDPVLRHFGGSKRRAVEVYTRFVEAAAGQSSSDEYYRAAEGRLLGSEAFLDEVKHRVGEHRSKRKTFSRTSVEQLLKAAARSSGLSQQELCSMRRNRRTGEVKEAVIAIGRERGIPNRELAEALGLDPSSVSRRAEAARTRLEENPAIAKLQKAMQSSARSGKNRKSQRTQACTAFLINEVLLINTSIHRGGGEREVGS